MVEEVALDFQGMSTSFSGPRLNSFRYIHFVARIQNNNQGD
jgi:hypothetical protein